MPKVKQVWKTTHRRTDNFGNSMDVQVHPNCPDVFRIIINLVSEKHPRHIGDIDLKNRCMFMKRDRSKHYHLKIGGYGFNWIVINELGGFNFDRVLFMEKIGEDLRYFLIPVHIIKSSGITKNFKTQGFELQTFLKYEYFEIFKTPARMSENFTLLEPLETN